MGDYFDLGDYSRPITTSSPQAQVWFDRGLMWCYGFHHEEAVSCFKKALEFDSDCAMAYWGIAFSSGPFYNMPWDFFGESELQECVPFCFRISQEAIARSESTTPVEQAIIRTLMQRYQSDQVVSAEEFWDWTDAYAQAMKGVYNTFPHDLDVITLYVEAMMNRTPWKLWDVCAGKPADGAATVEAINVLEEGLRLVNDLGLEAHAGMLHLYIHVMEMSPHPEKALRAADALRDLVPEGGHLLHMPSHIDVLCGNYYDAIVANNRAIKADNKYAKLVSPLNFYTTSRCHNFHLKMYAAMFLGQYTPALEAANGIVENIPDTFLRVDKPHMVTTLEGYYSMKMHVQVRFGKWQEIIDEAMPADPQLHCVTTAMYHYAKGVAYAATGQIEAAEEERRSFFELLAGIPPTRHFFNNTALDILAVGAEMLNGELEYRQGNYDKAFDHLRQAVRLDDNLFYTEPWAWMHPPRHALGALLLEQNQIVEAEQVYRADLGMDNTLNRPAQHPNNVWSLHGYVECLKRLGKHGEAAIVEPQLMMALARTDVEITASCCCRLEHTCCH